jgi:tRNA(adenine34) deaminase
MTSYEPSMHLALAIAREAAESADVPVGALVLSPGGEIIGRGRNLCLAAGDPTAHAEIVAIRQAATATQNWRLDGCTLITTLEPCTMCAGAVHLARIGRVVYGAIDERAGAAGSISDVLFDRRLGPAVEVISGVLADDCADLLKDFFKRLR